MLLTDQALQNYTSLELPLPRRLEEVLWLRHGVIPIEVEKSGGADGARPLPADCGPAGGEEGCHPVSTPRGLGPCTSILLLQNTS